MELALRQTCSKEQTNANSEIWASILPFHFHRAMLSFAGRTLARAQVSYMRVDCTHLLHQITINLQPSRLLLRPLTTAPASNDVPRLDRDYHEKPVTTSIEDNLALSHEHEVSETLEGITEEGSESVASLLEQVENRSLAETTAPIIGK
jgi:hypothetical protein